VTARSGSGTGISHLNYHTYPPFTKGGGEGSLSLKKRS
jgi:hypothetical protein